jgi:hypothetical protein
MKKIFAIVGPMAVTALAGWWTKRRQAKKQEEIYPDMAHPARS